jgi:hypothetical protein
MKYTVEKIMWWKPCYTLERVKELVGDGLDAVELAHLDIPPKDRVWVLIRMLYDTCNEDAVISFAGNCALRAYYLSSYAFACTYNGDVIEADAEAFATAELAFDVSFSYDDLISERQWQIDYLVAAIEGTR